MEKFIHNKTNGLDYELAGDYYLPCLKTPKSPKVGRFGMMYHNYLRNHKKPTYSGLLLLLLVHLRYLSVRRRE